MFLFRFSAHILLLLQVALQKTLALGTRSLRSQEASESGQGMVEYALILALTSIVVIAIFTLLGEQVKDVFCRLTCDLVAGGRAWTSCDFVDGEWIFVWE